MFTLCCILIKLDRGFEEQKSNQILYLGWIGFMQHWVLEDLKQ